MFFKMKAYHLELASDQKIKPAFWACVSVVGVFLGLGAVGCVSSSEDHSDVRGNHTRDLGTASSDQDELTEVTEEQLFGDLESGLDSPLWSEEERSSQNVIDKALSQSPYKDFDEATPNSLEDSTQRSPSTKQGYGAKGTGSKKAKKLGEMSKKGKGGRELKAASKKEKSR